MYSIPHNVSLYCVLFQISKEFRRYVNRKACLSVSYGPSYKKIQDGRNCLSLLLSNQILLFRGLNVLNLIGSKLG